MSGYLSVGSDDYAQTTDKAQLDVSGDLDLIICVEPANGWLEGGTEKVLAARRTGGSTFGRMFDWYYFNQGGGANRPVFEWKDSNETDHSAGLTSPAPAYDALAGESPHLWLRVTMDVENSNENWEVQFWYSLDPVDTPVDEVSWSAHGAPIEGTGLTDFFNSSNALRLTYNSGAFNGLSGKVYFFEMRNGIGGTPVARADFRTGTMGWASPPGSDGLGNDWTLNGGTVQWVAPAGGGLGVPQNVQATALSPFSILVEWDAVEDADAYDVERTEGESLSIVAEKIAETEFEDEGLTPETEYSYRVRAARLV